jgi:hypothetical protein
MDSNIHMIYTSRRKVFTFLLVLTIMGACQAPGKDDFETYRGQLVRISFDPDHEYGLKDYFLIDQFVVAHQRGPFETRFPEDTILIPPRKMVYLLDTTSTGQKMVFTNAIHMALAFNEGLERLNTKLVEKERYVVEEKPRMLVQGDITLRKQSGKKIEVLVPEGYPLNVEILER